MSFANFGLFINQIIDERDGAESLLENTSLRAGYGNKVMKMKVSIDVNCIADLHHSWRITRR